MIRIPPLKQRSQLNQDLHLPQHRTFNNTNWIQDKALEKTTDLRIVLGFLGMVLDTEGLVLYEKGRVDLSRYSLSESIISTVMGPDTLTDDGGV